MDNRRLDFLDVIRGIAITLVFSFHCMGPALGSYGLSWSNEYRDFNINPTYWLFFPFSFGFLGVAIFFVISGFCIHLSHVRSGEIGFLHFVQKRFFRIFPPYFICLMAFCLYQWNWAGLNSNKEIKQFFTHLFLVHNFNSNFILGVNPSFWSIAIEAQLYILYPLLYISAKKTGWGTVMIIVSCIEFFQRALISFGLTLDSQADFPEWINSGPFTFIFSWTLGVYIADKHIRQERCTRSPYLIGLMIFLIILFYFYKPLAVFEFPLAAIATGLWLQIELNKKENFKDGRSSLITGLFMKVGVVSYSFYLIHQPLVGGYSRLVYRVFKIGAGPLFIFSLLAVIPIYFISRILFKYLEIPSVELGKRVMLGFKK